jgi:hypothetical protein
LIATGHDLAAKAQYAVEIGMHHGSFATRDKQLG